MKESLSLYCFTTKWVQGKLHAIPDALSRAPIDKPDLADKTHEEEREYHFRQVISDKFQEDEDDPNLKKIEEAAEEDPDYQDLKNAVLQGFPQNRQKSKPCLLPYWNIQNELSVDKGLVLYGQRIIIPEKLRKDTLQKLHSSHQGIEKTRRRAKQVVYWPCINNDIDTTVSSCAKCLKYQPSQRP